MPECTKRFGQLVFHHAATLALVWVAFAAQSESMTTKCMVGGCHSIEERTERKEETRALRLGGERPLLWGGRSAPLLVSSPTPPLCLLRRPSMRLAIGSGIVATAERIPGQPSRTTTAE